MGRLPKASPHDLLQGGEAALSEIWENFLGEEGRELRAALRTQLKATLELIDFADSPDWTVDEKKEFLMTPFRRESQGDKSIASLASLTIPRKDLQLFTDVLLAVFGLAPLPQPEKLFEAGGRLATSSNDPEEQEFFRKVLSVYHDRKQGMQLNHAIKKAFPEEWKYESGRAALRERVRRALDAIESLKAASKNAGPNKHEFYKCRSGTW